MKFRAHATWFLRFFTGVFISWDATAIQCIDLKGKSRGKPCFFYMVFICKHRKIQRKSLVLYGVYHQILENLQETLDFYMVLSPNIGNSEGKVWFLYGHDLQIWETIEEKHGFYMVIISKYGKLQRKTMFFLYGAYLQICVYIYSSSCKIVP